MLEFPHHYAVTVNAEPQDELNTTAENLPALKVNAPTQFGGPGNQWSPEELLLAAAANCFVLSFRAVAASAKFEWLSIACHSVGELDKVEKGLAFTKIKTSVTLLVSGPANKSKAETLLRKAEKICIVSNSLTAEKSLDMDVTYRG